MIDLVCQLATKFSITSIIQIFNIVCPAVASMHKRQGHTYIITFIIEASTMAASTTNLPTCRSHAGIFRENTTLGKQIFPLLYEGCVLKNLLLTIWNQALFTLLWSH